MLIFWHSRVRATHTKIRHRSTSHASKISCPLSNHPQHKGLPFDTRIFHILGPNVKHFSHLHVMCYKREISSTISCGCVRCWKRENDSSGSPGALNFCIHACAVHVPGAKHQACLFLACAFELCYNSRCRRARIILPTSVRRLVMLGEDGGRERGRSALPIFHYRIRPFKWVLISSPPHKSHTGQIKIMRAIQNLLQVTRAAAC